MGGMTITYGYLKEFLENPEKYGAIHTGSRCFGVGVTPHSDYDYFMLENKWDTLGDGIENINFDHDYEDNLFKSIHMFYDDKDYNILVMDKIEFKIWRFATTMFKYLIEKSAKFKEVIKHKPNRVNLFEEFKTSYGVMLRMEDINKRSK